MRQKPSSHQSIDAATPITSRIGAPPGSPNDSVQSPNPFASIIRSASFAPPRRNASTLPPSSELKTRRHSTPSLQRGGQRATLSSGAGNRTRSCETTRKDELPAIGAARRFEYGGPLAALRHL